MVPSTLHCLHTQLTSECSPASLQTSKIIVAAFILVAVAHASPIAPAKPVPEVPSPLLRPFDSDPTFAGWQTDLASTLNTGSVRAIDLLQSQGEPAHPRFSICFQLCDILDSGMADKISRLALEASTSPDSVVPESTLLTDPECTAVMKTHFAFPTTYTGYQNGAYSAACDLFPPSSNGQPPVCDGTGKFSQILKECVACNTDGSRSVTTKLFYPRDHNVKSGTVGKYVNKGIDCTSSDCACFGQTASNCVAASAEPTSETYCKFEIKTKTSSSGETVQCFSNACGTLTAYACPLGPNPNHDNPAPSDTNQFTGSKLHCDDGGETFSLEQKYYCGADWGESDAPTLVKTIPSSILPFLKRVKTDTDNVAETTAPTGYWVYQGHPYCADLTGLV